MASIGDTKAPAATVTRTQPTLEHEYAPWHYSFAQCLVASSIHIQVNLL
jgi:hypothetical protein